MTWLVLTGTTLAVIGLAIVIYCIITAVATKRAGLEDAEMRARLQRVVVINMIGLVASATGLIAVVMGVIFA